MLKRNHLVRFFVNGGYMSGIDKFHNVIKILTESFRVDDDAIEDLRIILETQHKRPVAQDEAEEIGRDLITLIETLANGRTITSSRKVKK